MNISHRMIKDKEAKSITVVEAFRVAEGKAQELTTKLAEAEREKKRAEVALDRVEKQAETQCEQLLQAEAEAELATAKDQIKALTKKLEEAEKAKD